MPHMRTLAPYLALLPTIALFAGLVFDVFTIDRPDALFENVVIIGYLTLSAVLMVVLQARSEHASESGRLMLLGALQFAFGNLASALMVLYSRSGTFAGSAIFIGFLALLFLGNEVLKDRYARTHLRVTIFFVLLLTYSTIFVPILFNRIGFDIFLISLAVAILSTFMLTTLLSRVARHSFKKRARRIGISVSVLSIGFVFLYSANLIPPVPLALKHIGIYHSAQRVGDEYRVSYEAPQWYEFWRDTNSTFSYQAGDVAFCFTSVFAPDNLRTEIRHRWERYDIATETWTTVSRIPFTISGGREGGFRGYTQTSQITPGEWRCTIETARGARIGRVHFNVESGVPDLVLESL